MMASDFVVGQVDPSTLGVPPNTPPFGMLNIAPPEFIEANNELSYNPMSRVEGLYDKKTPPQPLPDGPSTMPSQLIAPDLLGMSTVVKKKHFSTAACI
jgi:hypothetical protein